MLVVKKALVVLPLLAAALGAAVWLRPPPGLAETLGASRLGALFSHAPSGEPAPSASRGGRGRREGGDGIVPVLVAPARTADVPVTLDAVGTVQALNTVTVRPQVDGRLLAIAFREGQEVKRGDVLARIDPTTYQATFDQASAKKAQDEAQLANARLDLQRYQKLLETYAASRQQADTQKALVAQLEAQTRADQAAIDNAGAILGYTTIVAPIDGRTGLRMVDVGNLVRAGDPAIVVIAQVAPIAVLFNLPQQHLRAVNAAQAKGELAVEALDSDNRTLIDRGVLQVVDNQVDQTTGTVRMKASFPNAERQLWPGQFVNVRLFIGTIPQAVVVPTAAVQRGPNGPYVYALGADGRVAQRPVTVTQQDERDTVLGSGVTPPSRWSRPGSRA